MTAFNCYACHVRDGVGGVEEARQEFFETTQKEMGDEGRIPPGLDGVGAKLTGRVPEAGSSTTGARIVPTCSRGCPRFGEANVGPADRGLRGARPVEPVRGARVRRVARRVKSIGRFLAGGEALGCIKCHTFKGIEAEGVQAIDMTVMTRRLRRDWFHRYLVDPQAYRPGTRMPTAWPDGKTHAAAGPRRRHPASRSRRSGSSSPTARRRRALRARPRADPAGARPRRSSTATSSRGPGPRAIGVGYPEQANLAFDANDLRLALIWQGAFIDASRHWTGRGDGFQRPLGDNVLPWPPARRSPFCRHDRSPTLAQGPRQGAGLRVPRLPPRPATAGRPSSTSSARLQVEDFPEAVAGRKPKAATLRRTLTV